MTRFAACVLASLLLACGGSDDPRQGAPPAGATRATGPDPCTLVSAEEVAARLGPLGEPPYRVDDNRNADPAGDWCLYRAADGRHVQLYVDWTDGPLSFRMLAGTGGGVEEMLTGDAGAADTLEGAWEKAAMTFGQFIALKGATSVQLDPLGSRLDGAALAELAAIALGRVDAPLAYDGGAAAAHRAPPREPGDPCSLVSRQEAEALMGRLESAPEPAEDGSACRYPTPHRILGEPVVNELEVQWTGGFYTLGQNRQAMGLATATMAREFGEDVPAAGAGATAAGEPWDDFQGIMGGVMMAVTDDVLLQVAGHGVGGFGEEQARELLRIASRRLQGESSPRNSR